MARPDALHLALDLAASPLLATVMRQHPVPPDVLTLIRIAGGDEEAVGASVKVTGKDALQIRAASVFYIQQVLWKADADSYRVLGVTADVDQRKMAEHLRWLMKWLHPDREATYRTSRSASRVLQAWDQLKTPQRRRQYDRGLSERRLGGRGNKFPSHPPSMRRLPVIAADRAMPKRRATAFWTVTALAIAAIALIVISPEWVPRPALHGGVHAADGATTGVPQPVDLGTAR